MIFLLFFAMLAGVATVLSPCILPVLPIILSASASGGKNRPLGVIVGLITSFAFFTLMLNSLIQAFGLSPNVLRIIAILIIMFSGLLLLIPRLGDKFAILTNSIANFGSSLQSYSKSQNSGFISGLIIGASLGLVWTPCAGPILAAITTLVATQNVTREVVLLTIAYSLGAAIPLFLIAYAGQQTLKLSWFIKHAERIKQIFGAIMIATAFAILFHWDVVFQQSILKAIPEFTFDYNLMQKELQKLRGESPFVTGTTTNDEKNVLPLIAPAPPLKGITAWINSPPLNLDLLKGKVILIDFWTYSCINCIRTFPYLQQWYDVYKDKNFVIIGVHTPEFAFEKDEVNVKKAVERFGIKYPVALDNNYETWQAYYNSYWPAHYLIDQNGIVRKVHFGEGDYVETENAIRELLALPVLEKKEAQKSIARAVTPEIYLGYKRANSYSVENQIVADKLATYQLTKNLAPDSVGLAGEWMVKKEYIESESDASTLSLNFKANHVYLVLGGESAAPIEVKLDGLPLPAIYFTPDIDSKGAIMVKDARKYDVVNLKGKNGRHLLTLEVPRGIQVYAFSFGMEE